MCVEGIDFASIYDFGTMTGNCSDSVGTKTGNCSDSVYFWSTILLHKILHFITWFFIITPRRKSIDNVFS
jgi:hypothetical protein